MAIFNTCDYQWSTNFFIEKDKLKLPSLSYKCWIFIYFNQNRRRTIVWQSYFMILFFAKIKNGGLIFFQIESCHQNKNKKKKKERVDIHPLHLVWFGWFGWFDWLDKSNIDVCRICYQSGTNKIQSIFSSSFGEIVINKKIKILSKFHPVFRSFFRWS